MKYRCPIWFSGAILSLNHQWRNREKLSSSRGTVVAAFEQLIGRSTHIIVKIPRHNIYQ